MSFEIYIIRNKEGKYFCNKDCWVDGVEDAYLYTKASGAQYVVNFFATHHPSYGAQMIQFTARADTVLPETPLEKSQREFSSDFQRYYRENRARKLQKS